MWQVLSQIAKASADGPTDLVSFRHCQALCNTVVPVFGKCPISGIQFVRMKIWMIQLQSFTSFWKLDTSPRGSKRLFLGIHWIRARCFSSFQRCSITRVSRLVFKQVVGQPGQFVKGSLCPIDQLFSFSVHTSHPKIYDSLDPSLCAQTWH